MPAIASMILSSTDPWLLLLRHQHRILRRNHIIRDHRQDEGLQRKQCPLIDTATDEAERARRVLDVHRVLIHHDLVARRMILLPADHHLPGLVEVGCGRDLVHHQRPGRIQRVQHVEEDGQRIQLCHVQRLIRGLFLAAQGDRSDAVHTPQAVNVVDVAVTFAALPLCLKLLDQFLGRFLADRDLPRHALRLRDRRLGHLLTERVRDVDGLAQLIRRRRAWLDILCQQQIAQG
jgi:hypothetical protein